MPKMTDSDRHLLKIPLFMALLLLFNWIKNHAFSFQERLVLWRYDGLLYRIDQALLGWNGFPIARWIDNVGLLPLFVILYEWLSVAMLLWWWQVGHPQAGGRAQGRKLIAAYALCFGVGPLLYFLLPACGPQFAFGGRTFMRHTPVGVSLAPILLPDHPNAMPSLHVTAALLMALLADTRNRKFIGAVYAALIAFSTLAVGQHYFADLIGALPFALCLSALVHRNMRAACAYLAVTVAWIAAIRWGGEYLVAQPYLLRVLALLALSTVVFERKISGLNYLERSHAIRPCHVPDQVAGGGGGASIPLHMLHDECEPQVNQRVRCQVAQSSRDHS